MTMQFYFYDNYDIWEVDPSNNRPPVNITNGYGQKYHVKFRFLVEDPLSVYSAKQTILLTAFNDSSKYNGFFRKDLNKKGDPELLTMEPLHLFGSRAFL